MRTADPSGTRCASTKSLNLGDTIREPTREAKALDRAWGFRRKVDLSHLLYIRARNAQRGGRARFGVKKNLDRILKPGKLNGNVGNYEDEA
jgi:hypothetical protein